MKILEPIFIGGINRTALPILLENYRSYGVEQHTGHKMAEVTIGKLNCKNSDGKTIKILCGYIVMAIGARPVAFDTTTLSDKDITVIKVDDCTEVADISHAIIPAMTQPTRFKLACQCTKSLRQTFDAC